MNIFNRTFKYKKLFADLRRNFSLTNKNIYFMKNFEESRNAELKADLNGSEIILQTIWSNFTHFSVFNKAKIFENGIDDSIDYSKLDDNSYYVFQDSNLFNKNIELGDVLLDKDQNKIDLKFCELFDEITNDDVVIARVPQEFNLDLTGHNIKIINSGDSKLVADKFINVDMKGRSNFFEGKRLRTNDFKLNSVNELKMIIKSYIEAKCLNLIADTANINIKKLGVVNSGQFNVNKGQIDIRSAYLPQEDNFELNIKEGDLVIGSCHGNLRINTQKANIIIENLDCKALNINATEDNQCEIFINNLSANSKISSNNNLPNKLFINETCNGKIAIKCEKSGRYFFGSEDCQTFLHINSKTDPSVIPISSWDYMKRKINRVINSKKI
jgi:hypothetical protein